MIGDRDLSRLRSEYYAVLSRVFRAEPTEDLLETLARDLFSRSRGAAQMDMTLAEGWRMLNDLFEDGGPSEWVTRCEDEFMRLFVGPGVPETTPCESFYRSGKVYGEPLGWVREFMEEVGLEKTEGTSDAEDHLAFELEIMHYLISRQERAGDAESEAKCLGLQGKFFCRHLAVWAPTFFQDLEGKETAPFYGALGKVGRGFLAWEEKILEPWKPSPEEVRLQTAPSRGGWKGPVFDTDPPGESSGTIEEGEE